MKRYELLVLLLELAKQGCARTPVRIDKMMLSSNLEISAWTLNRWLRDAVKAGYVEVVSRGSRRGYLLTEKSLSDLSALLTELEHSIKGVNRLTLTGKVFRGLGEGGFYVSLNEYKEWFKTFLGFEPYPGTLNVRLHPESTVKRKMLDCYEGFRIPSTERGETTYCSARLFKAVINNSVEGGIVIPEKTVYGPDVLEVVAKTCLRETLGLKDGDEVKIEILLNP